MAPEVIENKNYTLKADVYSFGVRLSLLINLINLIFYKKFNVFNFLTVDYNLGNMFKENSI